MMIASMAVMAIFISFDFIAVCFYLLCFLFADVAVLSLYALCCVLSFVSPFVDGFLQFHFFSAAECDDECSGEFVGYLAS